MLSFGWSEIALTAIIIIIVVGPKELPNLLRQIGSFSKSIKKITTEFKSSLNDIANETEIKDIKNIKDSINDIKNIDKSDENNSNIFGKEINDLQNSDNNQK